MKYPTKYRHYPFKRILKRKLRKIAFMIAIAALVGGTRYYGKYYNNDQLKKSVESSSQVEKVKPK